MVDGHYILKWYVGNNKVLWGDILKKVKMIPSRRWNPDLNKGKGAWTVPNTPRSIELLNTIGFKIKEGKSTPPDRPKVQAIPPTAWKALTLNDITDKARDYQINGVKMMKGFDYKCILADQAGSGKTLQSLSAVRDCDEYPVLIICPSTLKINWKREIKMWGNPLHKNSYYIVEGRKKQHFKNYKYVIINYDILYDHVGYITKELKPKFCIIDEVHELRAREKVVSRYYPTYKLKQREYVGKREDKPVILKRPPKKVEAAKWIVNGFNEKETAHAGYGWEGIPRKILMSATPMPNNAGDIYNILNLVDKKRFNNQEKFIEYFCEQKDGFKAGIKVIKGSKNMDQLYKLLIENYMVRRLKKDILKELPPRIKTVIPQLMDDKDWREYQRADEDFINWVKEVKKKNIHTEDQERSARFQALQELALKGKLNKCFRFVDDLLADPDKKVIIFAHHRHVIDEITKYYGKEAVCLHGGMNGTQKQEAVDKFQKNKKIRVFAGNLQAASVGITLTASDTVVFFEFGWLPHNVDQGIDRSHRIGIESDVVNAYFLPAAGTIEKLIMTKLDRKLQDMEKGIDGKDSDESDMFLYLWEEYEKRVA